jgi:nucleoside-diphosphate-sugar epimerase
MRVFVAGATGVLGRQLVPQLRAAGHEVVASTTTTEKLPLIREMGAEPVRADLLDAAATARAVRKARPDAIVHEATALTSLGDMRNVDQTFERTNQLRTVGTRNLLAAAQDLGACRFVAQSFCGWPYGRSGSLVKTEDDPLDTDPLPQTGKTLAAIKELEAVVTDNGGVVLRYGGFYGPGTSLAPGGPQYEAVRKRMLPIVGKGAGLFSFLHVEDAASATVAALAGPPGVYNVVDDEPAAARDWIPYLASIIGAKPPRRLPTWMARWAAGSVATAVLTVGRGASNAKAKQQLGWKLRYPSWRDGFQRGLS